MTSLKLAAWSLQLRKREQRGLSPSCIILTVFELPMTRAFATLALFFLTATATAAAEKGWLQVRTPHFVVVSNGGERQARDVALKFEQIHSAFAHGFPQLRTDSGAETIVLAVRDESDMKALLPGE